MANLGNKLVKFYLEKLTKNVLDHSGILLAKERKYIECNFCAEKFALFVWNDISPLPIIDF